MTGTMRRRAYRKRFVITFSAEGGTASAVSMKTGGDGTLDTLPTATRSGYTFLGWFRSSGAQVTTETVFTADETVYAHWQAQLVTITVTGYGGYDSDAEEETCVTINGTKIYRPGTYQVTPGTVIRCQAAWSGIYAGVGNRAYVYLNGSVVVNAIDTAVYNYTATKNATIRMVDGDVEKAIYITE